jgi:hypothetical protein
MKLNVKALVLSLAILWGLAVFLTGLANFIWPGFAGAFLKVIASLYPGYKASGTFEDLIVGTLYAVLDGAVGGWIFARLYNYWVGKAA